MNVKILFSILLMSLVSLTISAQTYCYKQVSTVNPKTEVRSKGTGNIMYITFTKNGSYCYESDRNGNAKVQVAMKYSGINNKVLVYEMDNPFKFLTYKFASDYSRLNVSNGGLFIYVYERVSSPEEAQTPETLY
ncbi:MAG: hypothetical protein NC248_06075 [Bacteroides sp.]|nr:hypothetical protein [Bacteroides sp.]MCM1390778.1 hypothetical protein [Bacteroides sp.]